MKAKITIHQKDVTVDLSQPLDISLPVQNNDDNPIAWYLDAPEIEPVKMGDFVGSVRSGKSSTNFNNIFFNPHGHGTHTECLGHITRDFYSVNNTLKTFFFFAELISVTPISVNEDLVITKEMVVHALNGKTPEALIVRTLPNSESKKHKNYSNSNPPYFLEDAMRFVRETGIKHLLVDLPSVDKEKDEGKLVSHKAFWNVTDVNKVNADARFDATITELIFVPDHVIDGSYLLNIQMASFENDASPSKPLLYSFLD